MKFIVFFLLSVCNYFYVFFNWRVIYFFYNDVYFMVIVVWFVFNFFVCVIGKYFKIVLLNINYND